MQTMPSVIVKKGGFFTALVSGVFSLLITCVLCTAGLGAYAIHVFDKKTGDLTAVGGNVLENLPKWKESLPPALADALHDRNAPDYRSNLDVTVKLSGADRHGRHKAAVRVKNNGSETVSLLAMNFVLKDANDVPVGDFVGYAATPIAFDDGDWRGPILPGSVREFSRWVRDDEKVGEIGYEITALRVSEPRPATPSSIAKSD